MRVLFVCTGNICRSPMAHGLFCQRLKDCGLADRIAVDSAATHAYQTGAPPDAFAQAVALGHGIDISALQARPIAHQDFFNSDIIAVMDRANLHVLRARAPATQAHRIQLLLGYAGQNEAEISDPYGQPLAAFEEAFDLIEQGVTGLLQTLRARPEPG